MQVNKRYEREISLRDLFFHILYKWRSILIAMLIGTVLLAGYAYLKNQKASSKAVPEAAAPEEVSLTRLNLEASNKTYQGLLDEARDYTEHAIVMKINPYQAWKATAVFTVVMEEEGLDRLLATAYNPATQIAAAYSSLLFDQADPEKLKEIFGVSDPAYVKDIVSAAFISSSTSFRITVYAPDETMAREGLAYFEEAMVKVSGGAIQESGKHKIVRISEEVSQGSDTTIENKQLQIAKNLATYQSAITTNNKAIDTDSAASAATEKSAGKKKSLLLYGIIGLLLGGFAMAGFYGTIYLLSGKFRLSRELTERFGIPVYGEMNHSRAHRPGKGIDRLIEKWEFRKNKSDPETVLEGISTLIREQGKSRILLTGTAAGEQLRTLANNLAERLGDGTELITEGDFLQNKQAITAAGEAEAVIIVEELHESKGDEIHRMLRTLDIGKTPVIGAIVI